MVQTIKKKRQTLKSNQFGRTKDGIITDTTEIPKKHKSTAANNYVNKMENLKSMDKMLRNSTKKKCKIITEQLQALILKNVLKILQWTKLKPDANFVNQSEDC